jgi:hypothetical protein
MANELLRRQVSLLEHLTGGAGIFGRARGLSNEPTLQGLDLGLLHLEARFSHEKRMQKIEWVLTRTLALLGSKREAIIRDFVEDCPPTSITWLDNAHQFHAFLKSRWKDESPEPAYLPDVAAYELAYATVRAGERRAPLQSDLEVSPGSIRLHPNAILLCCAFDIRPVLEGSDDVPVLHETRLAVTMLPGSDEPIVSELSTDVFELLEMLDQFADPSPFRHAPELAELIDDLSANGLIEVRQ